MQWIFSGFGYDIYKDEDVPWLQYIVVDGEGEFMASFNNTFEAKKWMKEHKGSECWRADGKWDWSRIQGGVYAKRGC